MSNIIDTLSSLGIDLHKTSSSNGGEYHGPCPFCKAGKDRFWVTISPKNRDYPAYYCRQCQKGGGVSSLITRFGGDSTVADQISQKKQSSGRSNQTRSRFGTTRKKPPYELWQRMCKGHLQSIFTVSSHLEEAYRRRGITMNTVKDLGFGYNEERFSRTIRKDRIFFDEGLVIPNYRGEKIYNLQIRSVFGKDTSYYNIKNSVLVPYHFTRLNNRKAPVIILESALDAAIIYQEAGDLVHAVALGSAQVKPDAYLKTLLRKSTRIIIAMDYDKAGIDAAKWWKKAYPNAIMCFTPTGKDVGDFHLAGGSVRSWVECLIAGKQKPRRPEPDIEIKLINDTGDAEKLLQLIQARDITPGVSITGNFLGLSAGSQSFAVDLQKVPSTSLELLRDMTLITYDGLSLIESLPEILCGCTNIESTRLQYHFLREKMSGPDEVSHYWLGYSAGHYSGDLSQAALAAHINLMVFHIQHELLVKEEMQKAYRVYAAAQPAVAAMRMNGMCLDTVKHDLICTNWESILPEMGKDPERKRQINSYLQQHGRKYADYYNHETGRMYPDIDYSDSATGRMSTTGINFLAVPKNEVREVFYAPAGKVFVGGDFCQLEMLVGALHAGDEKMVDAFKKGVDFHSLTASIVHNVPVESVTKAQRSEAKQSNYEVIYGGNSDRIRELKNTLRRHFPVFYDWLEQQMDNCKTKYQARTPAGKKVSRYATPRKWSKQLCNFPIQGGGSEIMFAALARLTQALDGLDAKIALCIHDEIILEVAEEHAESAKQALQSAMIQGFLEIFPNGPTNDLVKIKQGKTWADIT